MTDLWTDPASLGDPEAMRVLARRMRALAQEMSSRMEDLSRRTEGTTFEGPAAQRLSEDMDRRHSRVEGAARRLLDASMTLLRSAGEVEAQIAELRRRKERAREAEAREMWT